MPPFPLAARVLEVIADRGEGCSPRYRYGSGCLVAGRTVLTAAHVVAGAVSVVVRGPDKMMHQAPADPAFTGDTDGLGPDLALLEIIDGKIDVPAIGLAAVNRDSAAGDPVERCHVIGYPAFMERTALGGGQFRETADALGHVPVLSGLATGLLSVQVSSSPRSLPQARVALGDSPWSGMSGGPVVADGLLLAVVTEHAPREGDSAITATPLTALEADPAHPGWGPGVADPGAWWARLGASGARGLKRLPATPGRSRPPYWATVQEIRKRTAMLVGRQDELAAIASFAAGDEAYRLLVGEPWAGKTALLAQAAATLSGDVDVVCYFLSRREADADSSRFLVAAVPQLASLLDEDPPAADLHQFRALWQRVAERADTEGRPLLLVVDGLDEDLRPPGLPSVAALLPVTTEGGVHVLVSSRPHPELPSDIPAGHPLRRALPVPVTPFAGAQELSVLARQEIDDLLRRDDDGLAADVLGLLTAAAGPLAVRDLAAMTIVAPQSAALARRIRGLVITAAARSLQPAGPAGGDRYQFAHESLLAYAQADDDLNDPDFRIRIHQWAAKWRAADWPAPAGEKGTPLYLLDTYPSTLTQEPRRLAQLVSDIGWIEVAIASVGIDRVLANLRQTAAANPADAAVVAVAATVTGQDYDLRAPQPVEQSGYILRQLWMQAAELAEDHLAENIRSRLQSRPGPGLVPWWTTRRTSRAQSSELGRHRGLAWAVAVLPDGRVVTAGVDQRVLAWDPTHPGAGAAELGRHERPVGAVAVLPDERVVASGYDGRVLIWDPARPGADPVELGHHDGPSHYDNLAWVVAVLPDGRVVTTGEDKRVLVWDPAHPGAGPAVLGRHRAGRAGAVLADGRLVTGGVEDGRVLVWDPGSPGTDPAELGTHEGGVHAVAVLADGRVVTGGEDRRVLVWDPASPGTDPAELGHHDGRVLAVAVMADGRVVTGAYDARVLVWDAARLGADPAELGSHDHPVRAVAVLADGRVATSGDDGRVLVWDPSAPGPGPAGPGRHVGVVRRVAVLADGRLVTGGEDGRVLVWDPARPEVDPAELGSYVGAVLAVAVLADGRLVTGGEDGRVLVWDPARPEVGPAELGSHDGVVRAMAISADGRVATGGDDGRVFVWDPTRPGAGPAEIGHHVGGVLAVAVLADGRVVTGGEDGRVLVSDPDAPGAGPTELGSHLGWVWKVAVLADGRVVTGGGDGWGVRGDGRVLVWDPDAPTIGPVELGRHDGAVGAVAVLADGRVVTGGGGWARSDGRVLVWDPDAPTIGPVELGRHNGAVQGALGLADGRVLTVGADRRVLVWDLARAGAPVVQLSCSVTALIKVPPGPARPDLVIAHEVNGFSLWSCTG